MTTSNDVKRGLDVVGLFGSIIRDARSIPSGTLYAAAMSKNISLESYEKIIGLLEKAKLVKNEKHLLTWVGP